MGKSLLSSVLLFWLWNPVGAAQPVHFADPHLKAVVEQELWISDPTPEDMLGLTSLAAEARGIANLTGLEYATNLERLWIRWNEISDLSPLSGLTNLRFLDGHGNDVISDISPLAGLTRLETLILRYNRITDVSALSGMTNLDHLHLEWNDITDISGLSGLTNLREANLQYNKFSDISALAALTELEFLDIRGNPLNMEACAIYIPQVLANNPGIHLRHNACARHRAVFSSTAGGRVTDPGEGEFLYDNGEILFLHAEADSGFVFVGFFGTYNTSENPVSLTIEQDHRIQANFRSVNDPNSGNDLPVDSPTKAGVIHVDDDAPGDPCSRDARVSDPWEDGTREHPFDRIQEAIDIATDGATVFVHAGTYRENIGLLGKRLRLTGFDPADANMPRWPVIDGGETGPVVDFARGEGRDCLLQGFVITGGQDNGAAAAIRCSASSPTISNCLIVGNRATDRMGAAIKCTDSYPAFINCTIADNRAGQFGAGLHLVNSRATVINSILWGNPPREILTEGDDFPEVRYTTVAGGWPGPGNLQADPLFAGRGYWAADSHPDVVVEPSNPQAVWVMGDYHVQSQAGRWNANTHQWMSDGVTSPCIDAGDPGSPVGRETFPNGHIINVGAYGGTVDASRTVGEDSILGADHEW